MTVVKVLGSGCNNCARTAELIERIAAELDLSLTIQKETDIAKIMQYGAMSTPAVVIGEKLVHAGGIPSSAAVREWLEEL